MNHEPFTDTAQPAPEPPRTYALNTLLALAIVLPNLAVTVRRLHDTDRTGWWVLLGLVPVIGLLVLLWFYIQNGSEGANRYG